MQSLRNSLRVFDNSDPQVSLSITCQLLKSGVAVEKLTHQKMVEKTLQ